MKPLHIIACTLWCITITVASASQEYTHPDDNPGAGQWAQTLFYRMNTEGKWRYPQKQEHCHQEPYITDSQYWNICVSYPDGNAHVSLEREGSQPIDPISALADLYNKHAVIECRMAALSAMMYCKSQEEEDFLHRCGDAGERYLRSLLEEAEQEKMLPPFMKFGAPLSLEGNAPVGSFGYITNVPDYAFYQPCGDYSGFNVACVGRNERGEPLFMGFHPGDPAFAQGQTYKDIQMCLYEKVRENNDCQHKPATPYNKSFATFQQECAQAQKGFQSFVILSSDIMVHQMSSSCSKSSDSAPAAWPLWSKGTQFVNTLLMAIASIGSF